MWQALFYHSEKLQSTKTDIVPAQVHSDFIIAKNYRVLKLSVYFTKAHAAVLSWRKITEC